MPITLPPTTRRRFLAGSLAAGAGLLVSRYGAAADSTADPHRFALLSDTHVSGNRDEISRGVKMSAHLQQVAGELLALDGRPAAALIDGDCAYLDGKSADYALLIELLQPLRDAGWPIHLALGNHDHRDNFWQAIPRQDGQPRAIEHRHLSMIEAPRANWFVLDSLDVTNKAPGALGTEQLQWLTTALDARADRPALVMVHHNPDERPMPGGLTDTRALLEVLLPRKQVKVLFFGHTHDWNIKERAGLHLVNLPPVAYPFAAGKPSGWVDLKLAEAGATLELRAIDPKHRQHGKRVELKWRS